MGALIPKMYPMPTSTSDYAKPVKKKEDDSDSRYHKDEIDRRILEQLCIPDEH